MKKTLSMLIIMVVLCLSNSTMHAQPVNFLWVVQAGGTDLDEGDAGQGIAMDGSGNSIVTGYFEGTATFGNTTLTSVGFADICIAKYDADGNFLWVVQAGGTDTDEGRAIATDGSGNSIVTGSFYGSATFGDTTLTSVGFADIFIAKYDGDGNFLWVVQAGGMDYDVGYAIATDGSGNSIVTGRFGGPPGPGGPAIFGDTTLTSFGFDDIFIAKYDGDGNFLWVSQAGGTSYDVGNAIATDGLGNSIVTGAFSGPAAFGDTTLTNTGYDDFFIAKYDGDGNFLWVAQAGGTSNFEGVGIAMDGSGNGIVTGYFGGTVNFGDTTLTSAGSHDIFIVKYDSDGNYRWVVQAGGTNSGGWETGHGIATDGSGNSIVTGVFGNTVTFGDTTLTSVGFEDIFIAKYDGDGNFLWIVQAGGTDDTGHDRGSSIATDGLGNCIVTGTFNGTSTFGDTTLTSVGVQDIFIAKLESGVTGIDVEFAIPQSFNLSQNYPNPFNPTTTIRYSLSGPENISIKIYDVSGQLVNEINKGHNQAGEYEVIWDGRNNFDERVSSGVYFYQLSAGNYIEAKKMILIK